MKKWMLGMALVAVIALVGQQGPVREPGETVARPKKKADPPPAPAPSRTKRTPLPPDLATFETTANLVTVDVAVLDPRGNFIPNIPAGNFLILEDNVPQKIIKMGPSEAPMTVCMVIEFSNLYQQYWTESWYQTLTAAYGFLQTLRQEDYVAVVAYDLRPEVLSDFSQDKRKAQEAMQRLRIAAYSESNLYDALTDTIDRMKEIEGRKAIVLIASGVDTFSKLTFDKTRNLVQTGGTAVYAVGLMQALREWYDARGAMGPIARLDFLQADNQMRTFAKESGGMSFFPRFYGEFPSIFQQISSSLRNQYSVVYNPTNQARDGKFRKIQVKLVDPQTNKDLRITDQKGKNIKYQVLAKAGYTAPREVE
jgi:Ca-activated chloride channel family protein